MTYKEIIFAVCRHASCAILLSTLVLAMKQSISFTEVYAIDVPTFIVMFIVLLSVKKEINK